jgi:hypothetical protein
VACSHHPVRRDEGATTGVVEGPILLILQGDLVTKEKESE